MTIVLKWIAKAILTGFSFVLLLWPFSPRPACWFLRNLFRFGTYIRPKNYSALRARVEIARDLRYGPSNKKCTLDVISPAAPSGPLPVVFWLHGGAYIAGDKADVEGYCVQIAARGYIVVNVNYPLAPEAVYPAGVRAAADACSFIAARADTFNIDLSRAYFAGDSAGAQMSAQFVTAQIDAEYAQKVKIPQVVPRECIRGMGLFCGLYDAAAYAGNFDSHTPVSYVVKRVFWGVTGNAEWRHGPEIEEASVLRHIPPSGFPPVFLTDGNIGTFTEQGMAYAEALRDCGTPVEDTFYPRSVTLLPHEYQFNMRRAAAQHAFGLFMEFLERTKK